MNNQHSKEVPLLADYGRDLLSDCHFYSDDSCLQRRYDFVIASSALHYSENWQQLLHQIAAATEGYLYITRLPVVQQVPSFVFVQRPYHAGYNTEYLAWCLNRDALLRTAEYVGLTLVREFVLGENPSIDNAPEQNEYRGFLFQRPGT